ncbi:DUF4186 domain-containing protein [Paracoccus binzhouensis]|uniref:DUF4186 domain-containing protein n=1 Tax=Paracoccus binzhouensis TaxID=2796149 RepID=UPI0018EEE0D0|nr:DUF4186 domain-containing protein [Paracoccus binzhouensis]
MGQNDDILVRLGRSRFRSRFHLGPRERAYADAKGRETIARHADELIAARLAPAQPRNDGRQTPMRGHPVFVAQHATACCCRSCLAKWHGIPAGRALSAAEQARITALLMRWIDREMGYRPLGRGPAGLAG